jgi:hypothetical protein
MEAIMVTSEPIVTIPPATDHGDTMRPRPIHRFLRYLWGIIAHPIATIDALAADRSIGWAVAVAALGVVQVWGNMLLFAAFGYNWLGTLPLLPDPTYVGWFGYLQVTAAQWLPTFAALLPVLALFELVVAPGVAQLLSKAWAGRGTFEQMVNVLTFASVPGLLVGSVSEWLTGVPLNLLTGQPYFYSAAMQGAYGSTVAVVWTSYASAVYVIPWLWGLVLDTIGIRRVQRIPLWAAALTMLVGFALTMLITTTFVR